MIKKLSIIIPHYNSFQKLKRLLESIKVCEKIEIIVVDDNSVNNIMLKELKVIFPKVKFYKNTSGIKGAGASRNIGIKVAQGEWLMFADADDFFLTNAFEKIDKTIDEKFDIVYFLPTSQYEGSKHKASRHIWYKNLIVDYYKREDEEKLRYHWHGPWSKLIKRDLIDKYDIKFDEIIASNDINFSLKTGYYAEKIMVYNEEVYCITKDSNTLTTTMSKDSFKSRYFAAIDFNEFLREKGMKKYEIPMLKFLVNKKYTDLNMLKTILKKRYKIIPTRYYEMLVNPCKLIEEYQVNKETKKFLKCSD